MPVELFNAFLKTFVLILILPHFAIFLCCLKGTALGKIKAFRRIPDIISEMAAKLFVVIILVAFVCMLVQIVTA